MAYSVGLVGLGNIGALYDINSDNVMSHLKAITRDERFNLCFAYDPNSENSDLIKKTYHKCNIYQDILDLKSANLEIDVLVIASPTKLHLTSITDLLLLFNPALVLCEKPLSESLVDSRKIFRLCKLRKIKIVTNYMRRSLPETKVFKQKLNFELSGKSEVIIKYSGCFENNGSHFLDLMSYFYGPPIKVLQASSEMTLHSLFKIRATLAHHNAICTYVPLPSNSVVEHEVEVITDSFKLIIGRAGRDIKIYDKLEDPDFLGQYEYGKLSLLTSNYLNFMQYVYDDIYLALSSGKLPANLCDIETSLRNTKLIQELKSL
jgi:hypothetical protein